ncbi:MAG TPA: hypothetical protein VH478_13190 [Trebonia sp.]|nr:hypothetical protein [Trebonia sp.]
MDGGFTDIEARLARLRGGQLPETYDARKIAALAGNPGCRRRSVLDAAAVEKRRVASYIGFPAPFGQSPFAMARESAFQAQVKDNGAMELLALLREVLGLDLAEAHYDDLGDVAGNVNQGLRYAHTRQVLTAVPQRRGTMFDHPLLRFRVAGRHAYLQPDLVAFRHDATFHVVMVRSFPVIDGQADSSGVAAAAIQSAVFVLALRDLLAGAGLDGDAMVHHETVLVTPRDFANQPVASLLDVRKQLATVRRQVARMDRVEDIIAPLPGDLTFDLDADDKGVPRRRPGDLADAVGCVPASYSPECLGACEMCFFCREEASEHGDTGVLGKAVREDLGGIESVARALRLARGQGPGPVPPDLAEAATIVRRAARLRGEAMAGDGAVPGHGAVPGAGTVINEGTGAS